MKLRMRLVGLLSNVVRTAPDDNLDVPSVPSSLSALSESMRSETNPPAGGERLPERRSRPRVPTEQKAVLCWMGENEEYLEEPVWVVDRSANGMGIRLSRALPVGLTVWIEVEDDGVSIKGVVRHCEEYEEGYLAGLFQIHLERRRFDRQPHHETGTLHWRDPNHGEVSSPATVRDVSEQGFQLEVPRQVPVSSVVSLSFEAWECGGSTRYCRSAGEKYLVGLLLVGEPQPKDDADFDL